MSDIRAMLDEISTRNDAIQHAEPQTPRERRHREQAIATITAHAQFSFNAPTLTGFIAVLYGGKRVEGVVTGINGGSFTVATADGVRPVEIEHVEHSGTYNIG